MIGYCMNLRTVDLNLLVVFDALVTSCHVTRAAEKVGLSQPAMSNALRRLRIVFGDELLVRTPNGMQATPRALELAEPVRAVLRQVERVMEPDQNFDPTVTSRTFRIRLSDLLSVLVLPALLPQFDILNSKVSLDIVHLSPTETIDALERDELDLAVSFGLAHGSTIMSEPVMRDRMVCVVRKGHRFANVAPDMAEFLAAKHVRVSLSPTDLRFVDKVIVSKGQKRMIALNLPHWLVLPQVLRDSDLVSVMPERLFFALNDDELAICELPFRADVFEWSLYWHRRQDRNPSIRWLRTQFVKAVDTGSHDQPSNRKKAPHSAISLI